VKIVQIPKDLSDAAKIQTPKVFKQALGKTFRVKGFDQYGHIELNVTKKDTIWIEPDFLIRMKNKTKKK
jgi:hypothetical protein